MRIIIVGCGKVGSELAGQLSAAGHDLTLIDLSERRLNELSNMYDLATVKGSGRRWRTSDPCNPKRAGTGNTKV